MIHAALDPSGHVHIHSCTTTPVNLISVPSSDPEYLHMAKAFYDGWQHPNRPRPTIRAIFYATYSSVEGLSHLAKFSDYANKVGNTQMLFHGTKRACDIGENSQKVSVCSCSNCALCCILKGSYDLERAKGARMFGPGIYSTKVSSKADIYTGNISPSSLRTKAMIVNLVALGRTKMMLEACHDMHHAPHMYNSVTAATFPEGGQVQYHEAVVYRDDAICANAVILYA